MWHVHSELVASPSLLRRVMNHVKYECMARYSWVIAVGDSVSQGVLAAGAPPTRVFTVTNGIDLARATKATKTREQVCSELGIEETKRLILMFGIQPVNKGVDLALDAVADLVREESDVVLGIVGRERLQAYVREKLGAEKTPWLRIIKPVENVADLYSAATVFLSASRSEGFPYSVVEAMASGLPVILSDIPGVSWAHQSEGPVFFESGDSVLLATAIRETLNWSTDERERRSLDNRRLVDRRYDVVVWANIILERYMQILARDHSESSEPTRGPREQGFDQSR